MPVSDMDLIFVTYMSRDRLRTKCRSEYLDVKKRKYWEGGGNYVTSSIIVFSSYNVVSEIKTLKKIQQHVLLL